MQVSGVSDVTVEKANGLHGSLIRRGGGRGKQNFTRAPGRSGIALHGGMQIHLKLVIHPRFNGIAETSVRESVLCSQTPPLQRCLLSVSLWLALKMLNSLSLSCRSPGENPALFCLSSLKHCQYHCWGWYGSPACADMVKPMTAGVHHHITVKARCFRYEDWELLLINLCTFSWVWKLLQDSDVKR